MKTRKSLRVLFLYVLFSVLMLAVPVMAAGKVQKKTFTTKTKAVTMVNNEVLKPGIKGVKQTVKWTSANKKIVTVDKKGQWLAKKAGKTVLTGKYGKKTLSIKVTVQNPKLNYAKSKLSVGKTAHLILNGTDQKIKWSSSNQAVATVNSKGVVTARKAGTATIRATVLGVTFSHAVTVTKKATASTSKTKSANTGGAASGYVWLSATGSKYHSINHCGNMNPSKARQVSLSSALSMGYTQCSKCY